jgi:outer membrane protein assembly factor BamA
MLMLCFSYWTAIAQKECKLNIQSSDAAQDLITELQLTSTFPSKAKCISYVLDLPSLLMTKGYVTASLDSVWEDSSNVHVLLFTGKKYIWDNLVIDEKDWTLLNEAGVNRSSLKNKPFDQQKVNSIYRQLLDYCANNGYPFAKIYLDSILLDGNRITAKLRIDKAVLYSIDTILVNGNVKISKNFLSHYLGVREGDIYQQDKLDKIENRLAELSFVQQTQPPVTSMLNTGAELNLYLENRKSNQVNVLVGFLPANPQVGGKLLLTGEANLNLRNPFGNGETLGINWQQFQSKSPRLNLLFQRPYLFNSSVGMDMNFELYKRDSLFLNILFHAGISYAVSNKQSISVFVQLNKSNLLTVDTAFVKSQKRLPDAVDLTTSALAVQYDYNNTDYRFNPRRGNVLQIVTGFGHKTIQRNDQITGIKDADFDYSTLYDTVQENSYEFKNWLLAAHYFPLGKQATFKTALQGGWLQSPQYFQNELFQIGGFKILRGFDEESIYTNLFAVATVEYRYLLARNSYFFLFSDAGHAQNKSNGANYSHNYLGIGTGLAFETKTGIFNISYALGKRDDLKFDVRQSKIHIGFVSVF